MHTHEEVLNILTDDYFKMPTLGMNEHYYIQQFCHIAEQNISEQHKKDKIKQFFNQTDSEGNYIRLFVNIEHCNSYPIINSLVSEGYLNLDRNAYPYLELNMNKHDCSKTV